MPLSDAKPFVTEFASLEQPGEITSSHALDMLAEIYAKEGQVQEAAKAYDLLATEYDPIRANYWGYLKETLAVQ